MSQQQSNQEDGDEPATQPVFPSRGPDREEMVSGYLPESDDWSAKTLLELTDPASVAVLRQIGELYPEVDDLQPIVDEFLDEFLKSRTSVAGQSREEYQDILVSMFGGHPDQKDSAGVLASALAGDLDDDD
jgi:hypothetical protein